MHLSEKIYYCRRRAGKSQEALAEQLGVSRQAISKWEAGDAEPEIRKLRLLADAFGVTVDWLLSDEEPAEEPREEPAGVPDAPPRADWLEAVPGLIGRLLRRYGWLFGVYTAVSGAGFVLVGGLARAMTRRMFSSFGDPFGGMGDVFSGGGTGYFDGFGSQLDAAGLASGNPVYVMGTVILGIGVALVAAGIVLAVVLKRRGRE